MGTWKNSDIDAWKEYTECEPVDKILLMLKPYKPKKLILGQYYLQSSMVRWVKIGNSYKPRGYTYKGIPIQVSADKYRLDFEI